MSATETKQARINLLSKYDIPCPRYTSYPTVPYWDANPSTEQWIDSLNRSFQQSGSAYGIYIHVPFCETLCTYCGCNNTITKNHDRESPYVDLLLNEWRLYNEAVEGFSTRPLKQIHLGGGTPTFLSADNLKRLLSVILDSSHINENDFEGSIEVDPRRTKVEQLAVLRELGFQRLSLGVQDFDPKVQNMVRRFQPYEMTEKITLEARNLGYESVNFDLIYGLPGQTMQSIEDSAKKTIQLRPDRIALYSLAIVPWIKPAQRSFSDDDLPTGHEKRELYDRARELLLSAGYLEIGMDHFALPTDALFDSYKAGTLHRNFMGYTDQRTDILLGLGVSSISETPDCFHQNEKVFPVYERRVGNDEIPTHRGHLLTDEDRKQRALILEFMTQLQVELDDEEQLLDIKNFLETMVADGLVDFEGNTMRLTEKGKPFLRNACMALDKRLRTEKPIEKVFSQSL